ncbi:Diphthine--ammonia ligase [Cucumispora dikerogammari]|nr:Diphthine--ammonia ligase [Cucumispora dikerogammari]
MARIAALISGGKDSFFAIKELLENPSNKIVALIHIRCVSKKYLDSYMFQTVGSEVIEAYSKCMNVPLLIYESRMNSINLELEYKKTEDDEVEDLYRAVHDCKSKIEFDAICSGAILSNYQKYRVDNVCNRLGLKSFSPLWGLEQKKLLERICESINAIVIKVATVGMGKNNLGMSIKRIRLIGDDNKYFNWCGEGGEYETLTLDTPFFLKRLEVTESLIETHPEDENKENGVFYLRILGYKLIDK